MMTSAALLMGGCRSSHEQLASKSLAVVDAGDFRASAGVIWLAPLYSNRTVVLDFKNRGCSKEGEKGCDDSSDSQGHSEVKDEITPEQLAHVQKIIFTLHIHGTGVPNSLLVEQAEATFSDGINVKTIMLPELTGFYKPADPNNQSVIKVATMDEENLKACP